MKPAIPPHILPAGAPEPDVAGGAPEEEGGGSGPALTTPVGVKTGIPLALGVAAALAVGLGACAAADGLGGGEQLTSALHDRNVRHSSARLGLLMRQH